MKVKKGTVALYVVALMLVTAGYWSYISNESKMLETVSVANENTVTQQSDSANETQHTDSRDENLGDATLVSNNDVKDETANTIESGKETTETIAKKEDDYFESSKLSRDKMYSQTLETYNGILNNSNVSEEQKTIVTQEITKLNKEKNAIMICENLMSTKGFDKCVIFVNIDSISVIVGVDELKTDEIAQIQNIISREIGAKVENIHIMTKK